MVDFELYFLYISSEVQIIFVFKHKKDWLIWFIVFNATFSNISAISWRPALVVEEAGENHRP
jgi:hypothetical protein